MYKSKLKIKAAEKGLTIRELLEEVLADTEGNKFRAAVDLEVTPNTIHNWLKLNGLKVKHTIELVSADADKEPA